MTPPAGQAVTLNYNLTAYGPNGTLIHSDFAAAYADARVTREVDVVIHP